MKLRKNYKNLQDTLKELKKQVIDSLPYVSKYIPSDITTPEELFYFLKDLTKYKKDPKGVELLQSVQTLLSENNYHGTPGKGDCDCFTILVLAACEYLGFAPQQVALVGRTAIKPTHIYSLVYDPNKNKMCAMDLTNPYYCMERKYNYKQTLDFMILELADELSSKATRKAKKAIKKDAKIKKVAARQNKKVRKVVARTDKKANKAEQQTQRKSIRQDTRTNRVENKGERKGLKQLFKVEKKRKKVLKQQGKQDIIKARTQRKLDNINQPQEFAPEPQSFEPFYNPQSAFNPEPGGYEPFYNQTFAPQEVETPEEEYYDEYQLFPEGYEEEVYEEEDGLSLPFIPLIGGLVNKISQKVGGKAAKLKTTRVGKAAGQASSEYQRIVGLQAENKELKEQLEKEKKQKYYYLGGALLGAFVYQHLISPAIFNKK